MNPTTFFTIPALLVFITVFIWFSANKSNPIREISVFLVSLFYLFWFSPIGFCANWGGTRTEELKNITVSKGSETVFIEVGGEVFTFKDAKTYTNMESITALKITRGYNVYGGELPSLKVVEPVFTK